MIARKDYESPESFNEAVREYLLEVGAELVFLVGCVHNIYPIEGISMYNIHPADPENHGGWNMYSLNPHRRVLLEIIDKIERGKANIYDRFFTFPTIHEVTEQYDSGEPFLQAKVEVPTDIIVSIIENVMSKESVDAAASRLQQEVVLPNEWLMLPTAVKMAAKKIIDKRKAV